MKARSADYIQLQNIYKAKARKDLAEVIDKVRRLEKETARNSVLDDQEVEAFCKGAAFVKLIKGRPLHVQDQVRPTDWADRAKYICQEIQDEESLLPIYLSFLAYDDYVEREKYPPVRVSGVSHNEDPREQYITALTDHTNRYIGDLLRSLLQVNDDDEFDTAAVKAKIQGIIAELGRANGAELHNIAALTGGMVAQEVIKVITKQYVPIDNTCVFDGIASKAGVFRL